MAMFKFLAAAAAAACLVVGIGQQAMANPPGAVAFAPLSAGLTVDGILFTVTSPVTWDSGNYSGNTACNTSGICLYMAPDPGVDPGIIIEAADSTNTLRPIESFTCPSGICTDSTLDLTADVTATVISGAPLTGAKVALGGVAPTGLGNLVSINENLNGAPGCNTINTRLGASPGYCAFTSASSSVTAGKDAGIGPNFAPGTYQLTTITESFTRAPEPASIASLLFGTVALAAVRRRTRRQS